MDKIRTSQYDILILIGIIIAVAAAFSPIEHIAPLAIAATGLFLGLVVIFLFRFDFKDTVFLSNIFIVSFLLRILLAFFLFNFVFLRNGNGLLGDAWPYSENGWSILQLWREGIRDFTTIEFMLTPKNPAGNLGNYDIWNAVIYSVTGKSPLSVIFINSFAGSLCVVFIYDIVKQIYNEEAAGIAAILTAFWPSVFFWSIQNLKEPISALLISVIAWGCIKLNKRFRFYVIFLIISAVLALMEFRGIAFLVLIAGLIGAFLWSSWRTSRLQALVIIGLLATGYFLCQEMIKTLISNAIRLDMNDSLLDLIYTKRTHKLYEAGSAFLAGFDFRNPFKLLLYTPLGLLVVWLAPFPWQLGSILQIVSLPETICYYIVLFYLFAGVRHVIARNSLEGIIIISLVFVMQLVFAFAEGNVGTLFRHRAMILPLMFALGGIGFVERNKKIKLTKQ